MSSSGNNDNIISSGDGGSVQEFSHYDFINAPQFVDFADLDRYDDPNADVFFGKLEKLFSTMYKWCCLSLSVLLYLISN